MSRAILNMQNSPPGMDGEESIGRNVVIVENRVSIHFTFPPFFRTRVREWQNFDSPKNEN